MRMPVPKLRLWLVRRAVLAGQGKPRAWHAAQPCERRRDCAYVDAAVVAVKGLYMVSWIGMQSGLEVHEVTPCVGWMRVGDKGPDAGAAQVKPLRPLRASLELTTAPGLEVSWAAFCENGDKWLRARLQALREADTHGLRRLSNNIS
jgi:hypothetical protein